MIEALYYLMVWFVLGSGLCFIIAAAFFGYPKEITEEQYNEIINRNRN